MGFLLLPLLPQSSPKALVPSSMVEKFRTSHRKTFSGVDLPDLLVLSLPSLLRSLVVCSKWEAVLQPFSEMPLPVEWTNNKTLDGDPSSVLVSSLQEKLLNPQPEDMPSKKVVNGLSMLLIKQSETDSVSTWTKNKTLDGDPSSVLVSSLQEKLLNPQLEDMPSKKVVNWLSMLLTKQSETDSVSTWTKN